MNRVGRLLACEVDSIVKLELENRFERLGQACASVLSHDDPGAAEARAGRRGAGIVREYADALAAYVRGVLIKDQDRATGVTLRPAEARDLYGDALGRLQNVPRLLPNVICGLIGFAMNDFSLSEHPTGVLRLDRMMSFFAPLVGRKGPAIQRISNSATVRTIALCPVDHGVDRVMRRRTLSIEVLERSTPFWSNPD